MSRQEMKDEQFIKFQDEFYNLLIDDSILLYKDKYLLEKVKGFRIKYKRMSDWSTKHRAHRNL